MTQAEEDEMIAALKAAKAAREAAQPHLPAPEPIAPPVTVERRFPAICETCGQPFEAIEATTGIMVLTKRRCDQCVEEYVAKHEKMLSGEKAAIDLDDEWAKICPTEFRTIAEGGATDAARLARDCQKLAEITSARAGLLLRGDTGRCKTRAMFRLMRKFFDRGESIVALTSGKFARQYQDAAGSFTTSPWFDGIASAGAFFLDDLGRSPWTPNVWGQFFELIDDRAKNHRPFFITSNETSDTMKAKCADPVTWGPLDRRLRENCAVIVL